MNVSDQLSLAQFPQGLDYFVRMGSLLSQVLPAVPVSASVVASAVIKELNGLSTFISYKIVARISRTGSQLGARQSVVCVSVWRRYNRFRALDRSLKTDVPIAYVENLRGQLPPSRKRVGTSTRIFLQHRQAALEKYIGICISRPELYTTRAFRSFLAEATDIAEEDCTVTATERLSSSPHLREDSTEQFSTINHGESNHLNSNKFCSENKSQFPPSVIETMTENQSAQPNMDDQCSRPSILAENGWHASISGECPKAPFSSLSRGGKSAHRSKQCGNITVNNSGEFPMEALYELVEDVSFIVLMNMDAQTIISC